MRQSAIEKKVAIWTDFLFFGIPEWRGIPEWPHGSNCAETHFCQYCLSPQLRLPWAGAALCVDELFVLGGFDDLQAIHLDASFVAFVVHVPAVASLCILGK